MKTLSKQNIIKLKLLFFIFAIVLLSATGISAVNSSSDPVSLTIDDWGDGFVGNIDLTNTTSSAYNSWEIGFDFPYNITSIWSAKIKSHSGNHYVIENESWNGAVPAGSAISFGFQGTPGNITQTITNVTVNGIPDGQPHENSPPVANNDTDETSLNTAVIISVLSNDTDADGDTLSITSVNTPQNGTSSIQGSSVNYTPNANFSGTDSFTYTVNDGNDGSDTATVTISVRENNTETYTITASVIGSGGSNYPEFVQPMAGDPLYMTGNKVTFNGKAYESLINNNSWSPTAYPRGWKEISQGGGGSANGTITPNGKVTLNEGESQIFTISPNSGYRIKDVLVDEASVGQIITYTFDDINSNHTISAEFEAGDPIPNPPVANNDSGSTEENTALTLNVLSNDTGEDITINSVTVPAHGAAEISGNTIIYTPETDYTGNDTFNYTIIDSQGQTDEALVSISVIEHSQPIDPIPIVGNNPFSLGLGTIDVSISETGRLTPTNPGSPIENRFSNINNLNSLKKSALSMAQGSITFLYLTKLKEKLEAENASSSVVNKILQTFGPNFFLATTYQETGIGMAQSGNGYFQIDNPLTGILQDAGAVPVPEKDYLDYFNFLGNRNYNQVIQQFNQNSFCTSAIVKSYYNSNALLVIMKNLASSKYTTREFPIIPFAINYANNSNHSNSVILPNSNNYSFSSDSADGLMRIIGYAYNRGYSHPSIPFILMNNTDGSKRINYYINYGQYLNGTDKGNDVPNGGIYEGTKYMFQIPAVFTSLQNMTQNQYDENISKTDIDNYLDALTALYSIDTINAGKAMASKVMDGNYAFNSPEFHKKFAQIAIAMLETSAGHSEDDPTNNSPTANDDSAQTTSGTAVSINVLANDTDADGDTLTISAVNTPQNGTAEIVSSSIVYTPGTGFTGTDTFEYTVSDGNGGTDTATVTVTVSSDPIPITYTITASVIGSGGGNYPVFIQPMAGDPLYMTGDKVTFNGKAYESLINNNSWSPSNYPGGWKEISQGSGGSANGTLTPSGEVTVNEGESQIFTISPDSGYRIKDVLVDEASAGRAATYTFSDVSANHTISAEFEAGDPTTPPEANNDSGSTEQNIALTLSVLSNDTGEGTKSQPT